MPVVRRHPVVDADLNVIRELTLRLEKIEHALLHWADFRSALLRIDRGTDILQRLDYLVRGSLRWLSDRRFGCISGSRQHCRTHLAEQSASREHVATTDHVCPPL